MLKYRMVLLMCFVAASALSQSVVDTIKNSFNYKPSLYGKFGTRNSFVDNYRALIFGVHIGLAYNGRMRLALGYNTLHSSAPFFNDQVYYFNRSKNQTDSSEAQLKLRYLSVLGEYIYHDVSRWKFSIPLQFGFGQVSYQYLRQGEASPQKTNTRVAFIYEPGVSVEYKLMRWIGLSADIGFRFVVTDYKYLNERINSPTFAFKTFVYYGEMYKYFKEKYHSKSI